MTFRTSRTRLWWGGPDHCDLLTPAVSSAVVVSASQTVDRQRRLTDSAEGTVLGMTADGISVSFNSSFTLRSGAESAALIAKPVGILVLHRLDAGWALACPMAATARPLRSASEGVVGYAFSLSGHVLVDTNDDVLLPVVDMDPVLTPAGPTQESVGASMMGYMVDPNLGDPDPGSITYRTTAGPLDAAGNDSLFIEGAGILAEGSQP